jgi:RNA polymerase sigma factor (sigma-70 family)
MELEAGKNLSDKAMYDYRLIRAAIDTKDQKAYAELMDRYRDSICFMLLKMVNNRDDADDLTIEAFGKAFKKLHQYTPNYAFSTWLFKIASNNCIDFIRKKKKRQGTFSIDKGYENSEGSEIGIDLKSDVLNPEEVYIREQKIKLMQDVVKKLKPRYRRLVELRYFKEFSYDEIAQELELPLGTVKAQLFRAREFLFNILKNQEGKI